MLEPLIKLAITHLDTAVDWYLERQRLVIQFLIPGTLLFVFMFFVFSGAGGAAFLLFVFVAVLEGSLASGLYLFQQRYQDFVRIRHDAADALEATLFKSDVFGEMDTFLQTPFDDPELEQIRAHVQQLPDESPPQDPDSYCGAEGDEVLDAYARYLRTGIATKFIEDFSIWWNDRRDAKRRTKTMPGASSMTHQQVVAEEERRQYVADAVEHVPSMSGQDMMVHDRKQVEREAAKEVRQADKEQKKAERQADRMSRKVTKQALKVEKKQFKAAAMSMGDHEPTVGGHFMPGAMQDSAAEKQNRPQSRQARRRGGKSEAAAIHEAMKAGFTAHHFDKMQQMLLEQNGKEPSPNSVLKALRKSQKLTNKAVKKGRGKTRAPRAGGRGAKQTPLMMSSRRPYSDMFRGEPGAHHARSGGGRGFIKVVLFLGLVGAVPFVVWRVPHFEGHQRVIIGEVNHRVIDRAPDWKHQLRTPFEGMFGNRPVTLEDGTRIYVAPPGYNEVWPESWGEMFEKGYSIRITAKTEELLFGGFTVATITGTERVSVTRPIVDANRYSAPEPRRRRR